MLHSKFQFAFCSWACLIIFSTRAWAASDIKSVVDSVDVYNSQPVLKSHPDSYLNIVQLINKYGYNCEVHTVETSDKYLLGLYRITGRKENPSAKGKRPVLVLHGLLSSAIDWIQLGPGKALPYLLADAGYDVWLGNVRGNRYSRANVDISPDDKKFWDFSWHEMGMIDLPTMIDYVLEKNGHEKLYYIGHSQGTTTFFVLMSMIPAYNEKIEAMYALAPVAYVENATNAFIKFLAPFATAASNLLNFFVTPEVKPAGEFQKKISNMFCVKEIMTQAICENILFVIAGYNPEQTNKTLLPVILSHSPGGASLFQIAHYAQLLNSGTFQQYDYGLLKNMVKYGHARPPKYPLKDVTAPVYMFYSSNDNLAKPKDVYRTFKELGNVKAKIRVPFTKWNHLDFLWGMQAREFLYDKVINLMNRHQENLE